MFDVAFSLLICCSLVAKVKTKPFSPFISIVSPTILPGSCLTYLSLVDIKPIYGPPKLSGFPRDCPSHATISAPISPGFFIIPSDIISLTTTIKRAPLE